MMYIKPELTTSSAGSITCYVTIQYREDSNSAWTQAVDTTGAVIGNLSLSASNGVMGTVTKNFDVAGEYRAFSTNITGEGCGSPNNPALVIKFGDTTYGTTDCTLGPL